MENIKIKNFGPINDLNIKLGDLTILLGPQASGKTIFLQILKLLLDKDYIFQTLERYNFVIKKPQDLLDHYFGENLASMWRKDAKVEVDGHCYHKKFLLEQCSSAAKEQLFYIPAQRILSISDGRPKNFMEYDTFSPFVLRNFSETLRLFFQNGMGEQHTLFPLNNRLKNGLKRAFDKAIFHGGEVVIDETASQKKMRMKVGDVSLPFMTWSAGQKEFMPLLMAIYCLSGPPVGVINREQYKYAVIEEPEMGLHPQAIQTVILQMLEFIKSGYKIIVSTHSTVLLEFAWTYRIIQNFDESIRVKALCELFDISPDSNICKKVLAGITDSSVKTYYFSHTADGVKTSDISSLDVTSENMGEAEWGGLSQFATRASEVVSKYMVEYGAE